MYTSLTRLIISLSFCHYVINPVLSLVRKCAIRELGSKNLFHCRMYFKSENKLRKCVAIPVAIIKSDDTQCPKLVFGFSNRSPCKISRFAGSKSFQYH